MNGLKFSSFQLFYFGNLLNLFLTTVIILGIIILFTTRKEITAFNKYVLLLLSAGFLLPLIVITIITSLNINFPSGYILGYATNKVIIGFLFIMNECIQVFTLLTIILLIFSYKRFTYLNALYYTTGAIIILVLFSFIYTTGYNDEFKDKNSNNSYDIAIVLGAAVWSKNQPSPLFKQRIEKAYELYNGRKVGKIHLTGGNAPGEISESQSAKNYLLELGMNEKNILLESSTATTSEQIKFIKNDLIDKWSFKNPLIVSDQFHLKRVLEMCDFFQVNAVGVESGYKLSWKKLLYYRVRDSIGLLLFWLFAI